MLETSWAIFVVASLIVIAAPGQDMVLVMSRSLAWGTRAGIMTAAGVSVGLLGHTALAALGLGALLQTSALFFTVLKIVGAAYLIYIGVKTFFSPPIQFSDETTPAIAPRKLFVQGALSNISNPKVAIFYFAFLPQFVAADTSHPTLTLLTLGTAFAALTFVVKALVGYVAGRLSGWLRSRPAVQVGLNRVSGTALVGLGAKLALEGRTQ